MLPAIRIVAPNSPSAREKASSVPARMPRQASGRATRAEDRERPAAERARDRRGGAGRPPRTRCAPAARGAETTSPPSRGATAFQVKTISMPARSSSRPSGPDARSSSSSSEADRRRRQHEREAQDASRSRRAGPARPRASDPGHGRRRSARMRSVETAATRSVSSRIDAAPRGVHALAGRAGRGSRGVSELGRGVGACEEPHEASRGGAVLRGSRAARRRRGSGGAVRGDAIRDADALRDRGVGAVDDPRRRGPLSTAASAARTSSVGTTFGSISVPEAEPLEPLLRVDAGRNRGRVARAIFGRAARSSAS